MAGIVFDTAYQVAAECAEAFEALDPDEVMRRHQEAMGCRDLEERLLFLNAIFGVLVEVGSKCLSMPDPLPEGETAESSRDVEESLGRILAVAGRIIRAIGRFEGRDYAVEGAEEFRQLGRIVAAHRNEVRRRLADASRRPANPRPVAIDESGRIVEAAGQDFGIPGLDPAVLLAGMREAEAGEGRPLHEIMEEMRR